MSTSQALLIAGVVIGMDAIIIPAIISAMIAGNWTPISDQFPGVATPPADAPRWNFASLKVGMLNMGWSVHLIADETHLHMVPTKFCRWLGMKAASVPWDKIEYVQNKWRKWAVVKLGPHEVMGPREAFSLAKREPVDR